MPSSHESFRTNQIGTRYVYVVRGILWGSVLAHIHPFVYSRVDTIVWNVSAHAALCLFGRWKDIHHLILLTVYSPRHTHTHTLWRQRKQNNCTKWKLLLSLGPAESRVCCVCVFNVNEAFTNKLKRRNQNNNSNQISFVGVSCVSCLNVLHKIDIETRSLSDVPYPQSTWSRAAAVVVAEEKSEGNSST